MLHVLYVHCTLNGEIMKPAAEFGKTVRRLRLQKGFGLRELAKKIGLSPTYLSRLERGEVPPPAEEGVLALAKQLGQNSDEFLGLAGRLPSDLPQIIQKHPRQYAALLRSMRRLSATQMQRVFELLIFLQHSSPCDSSAYLDQLKEIGGKYYHATRTMEVGNLIAWLGPGFSSEREGPHSAPRETKQSARAERSGIGDAVSIRNCDL
jgi:transcriptional regulator with XRE-family HTH domain